MVVQGLLKASRKSIAALMVQTSCIVAAVLTTMCVHVVDITRTANVRNETSTWNGKERNGLVQDEFVVRYTGNEPVRL